ncbi:phage head closure protein [Massilia sp. X63]|uniref:phage head closure protein n=1 Tax=Massilia sp. X63 TaxID=3237285 RepID=UPI0034DD8BC2
MNDKITIQRPPTTKNAAGQIVGEWSDVAAVWADVRHQSGAEVLRNGLPVSTVRASIMIRARADVDNSMRVAYKGALYNIKSVLPNDRDRRFMFLVCESAK